MAKKKIAAKASRIDWQRILQPLSDHEQQADFCVNLNVRDNSRKPGTPGNYKSPRGTNWQGQIFCHTNSKTQSTGRGGCD